METKNKPISGGSRQSHGSLRIASSQKRALHPVAWFPGLNGLRFLAASLVVLMHIHNNMGISGLPQLPQWPILFKGLYAVSFFFVLSGFLITYLLLKEQHQSHTISIRAFYLRRVFRIWPLYFIVIAIGALFYWRLVPILHLTFESDYPHGLALLLYTLFMANLMNSLYHVGGILHITWSIAVEEQFYLFWAPLVKKFHRSLPRLIAIITLTSLTVNILNTFNAFHLSKEMQEFIRTLQFHYMGFGAGFAWLLFTHPSRLLDLAFFRKGRGQAFCLLLLLAFFFGYKKSLIGEALIPIPLALLFGWLIVNAAANPNKIVSFENRILSYLGQISYGIYMFHMPIVYAVAFLYRWSGFVKSDNGLFFACYFILVFIGTIAVAAASYAWLEQPILRMAKRFKQT